MDREFILALLLAGAATLIGGLVVPGSGALGPSSGALRERMAFRRLLSPLAPAVVLLAGLAGFALVETEAVEAAEVVPTTAILLALAFGVVVVRAVARAAVSMLRVQSTRTAAVMGLLRPHTCIAEAFARSLTAGERAAVQLHEEAHVRHKDPLRLWLGQIVADLQWPAPAAVERLAAWRFALELARDDEARSHGIEGADLAAAVLKAARIEGGQCGPMVGLTGEAAHLRERVERLLAPLAGDTEQARETPHVPVFFATLALAFPCGAAFGERLISNVLGWSL